MNAFLALSDPTRLSIFELLAKGERTVGEIVNQFSFTPPAISQHLKVLKQARLVSSRAAGQKRIYSVDQAGLADLEQWVERQRVHWDKKLGDLDKHLGQSTR